MSTDAGKILASAPIGLLIRDMAMAIADAQEQLDDAAIRSARKMAETIAFERDTDSGTESFNLLELGFAPTFYSFVEADLELVLETRISEDTSVGASVGAEASLTGTAESSTSPGTAGASKATDSAPEGGDEAGTSPVAAAGASAPASTGSRSSTKAVGMTMSADFQRKFGVETSGHTRITAKLVALPPPAQFLDIIGGR